MFAQAYASLQYQCKCWFGRLVCMVAFLCWPLSCSWPFSVAFALGLGQGKISFLVCHLVGLFLFAFSCFCHGPVPVHMCLGPGLCLLALPMPLRLLLHSAAIGAV